MLMFTAVCHHATNWSTCWHRTIQQAGCHYYPALTGWQALAGSLVNNDNRDFVNKKLTVPIVLPSHSTTPPIATQLSMQFLFNLFPRANQESYAWERSQLGWQNYFIRKRTWTSINPLYHIPQSTTWLILHAMGHHQSFKPLLRHLLIKTKWFNEAPTS